MEARVHRENNVLVVLSELADEHSVKDFCGVVVRASSEVPKVEHKNVYLCGDISNAGRFDLRTAKRVLVIQELSRGYEGDTRFEVVSLGEVPMLVHGLGVYYRRFFDLAVDHCSRILADHTFQSLTESTKPAKALRTGIYLTPVTQDSEGLHFRLLRCSTNLSGPTENFSANDKRIVDALNLASACVLEGHAELNHVLAQLYPNVRIEGQKQSKAKISAHADKTKDMPSNGIMAFCTFYDRLDKLAPIQGDPFDRGYKGVSGLTKLRFRLKENAPTSFPETFTLTLYPNSVFFMPLSTNRLYTHEILSSTLDPELLPTRLGYVVRCSGTEAVYKDECTFLKRDGKLLPLLPPDPEGVEALRALYAEENRAPSNVDYGGRFLFSMNSGDYLAPRP